MDARTFATLDDFALRQVVGYKMTPLGAWIMLEVGKRYMGCCSTRESGYLTERAVVCCVGDMRVKARAEIPQ